MPWRETDAMKQRVEFVVRALQPGASHSALCKEFGISRKTGYKWLKRFEEVGQLQGLVEQSRRPKTSPGRTCEEWEQRVVALRREHGWAGRKLSHLLKQEGIRLPAGTVDRILRRRGLTQPSSSARAAVRRFERSSPNELWQMDFKGPLPSQGSWQCVPLSVLDDHSRYLVGLYPLQELRLEGVQRSLREAFERCGLPAAMLMDHGTPWWSTTNGHGLTQLSVSLIEQGIELIYGGICHPQTQGKIERMHRSLLASLRHRGLPSDWAQVPAALEHFVEEYNYKRPHEALDYQVPAQRYQPSTRAYQAQPREWEYPEGSDVRRLNSAGCLDYQGRRFFVCEALAHKRVRCEPFAQRALITYRHMHIREIDLVAGRTTAVVRPATAPKTELLPMS